MFSSESKRDGSKSKKQKANPSGAVVLKRGCLFFFPSFWNGIPGSWNDLRVNGTAGEREGWRLVGSSVFFGSAVTPGRAAGGRRGGGQRGSPAPRGDRATPPGCRWSADCQLPPPPWPFISLQLPPVVQYSTVTTTPRNTPTCFCSRLIDCYCFQILDGPKKLLQKVNNGFSFFFNLGSRLVTHMIGYG